MKDKNKIILFFKNSKKPSYIELVKFMLKKKYSKKITLKKKILKQKKKKKNNQ